MHVHRQFNIEADNLSKKALKGNTGWHYYEELVDGSIVSTDKLYIF
jgi:hypothetical protein